MVGWLFWLYDLVGYFMTNSFLYKESVLFQTIQFSVLHSLIVQKHFHFKLFSLFK